MKVKVNPSELSSVISKLLKIIIPKKGDDVSNYILFTVSKGVMSVTSSNYDMLAKIDIPVIEADSDFSFMSCSDRMFTYISSFKSDITISFSDKIIKVKHSKGTASFPGMNGIHYPNIKTPESNSFLKIDANTFVDFIERGSRVITQAALNMVSYMNLMVVAAANNEAALYSTNGQIFLRQKMDIEMSGDMTFMMDLMTARLLKMVIGKEDKYIKVITDDTRTFFILDNIYIYKTNYSIKHVNGPIDNLIDSIEISGRMNFNLASFSDIVDRAFKLGSEVNISLIFELKESNSVTVRVRDYDLTEDMFSFEEAFEIESHENFKPFSMPINTIKRILDFVSWKNVSFGLTDRNGVTDRIYVTGTNNFGDRIDIMALCSH